MKRKVGITRCWLFTQDDGTRNLASEFEEVMMVLLESLQASNNLILLDVDVRNEYGIDKSLRQGVMTHARNCGVKTEDIEMNNRWRKVEAANGKAASLNIRDHYIEVKLAITTLIRFSIAL